MHTRRIATSIVVLICAVLLASLVMQRDGLLSYFSGSRAFAKNNSVTPPDKSAADARLNGSARHEEGGWIYLHIEGPPAQLGF